MNISDTSIGDVLDAVRGRYDSDLADYSDCLVNAFTKSEAIFWHPDYHEFYWHCVTRVPNYIQEVILANAEAESHGSEGLFDLWSRVSEISEIGEGVRSHFLDEARHSRLFIHLTDLSFPGYLGEEELLERKRRLFNPLQASIQESQDASASIEYIVDNLVQMNIGEIRTRAHMFMIGPVLAAICPRESRDQIEGILSGLIHDEVTHIGYTARIMNELCRTGHRDLVRALYEQRVSDFNAFTLAQTRTSVELFGQNRFPRLLEI